MRITCRMRADDGLTDVCKCTEFTSATTGAGIAWACGQISEYKIGRTILATRNERTGLIEQEDVLISGVPHLDFMRATLLRMPETITLVGNYSGHEISVTIVNQKNILQIFYPRELDGQITPFEQLIYNAIYRHFVVLQHEGTEDAGSVNISTYRCPLFSGIQSGLSIAALCSFAPESTVRWLGFYRGGYPTTDPKYGELTTRRRMPYKEAVQRYSHDKITKTATALLWKGRAVTVICNIDEKTISICWDKWLNREFPEFIQWLMPAMYEMFFGPQEKPPFPTR